MTERIGVYFVEIESNHGNTQKDAKETCEKESITLKKNRNVLFLPVYNNLKQRKTKLE